MRDSPEQIQCCYKRDILRRTIKLLPESSSESLSSESLSSGSLSESKLDAGDNSPEDFSVSPK